MSTNIINGGLGAVIGQTQKVMLIDSNGNAIDSLSGGSTGVTSINGASGTITIAGAGDVSVSTVGTTVTVSGSGFGNVSGPASSTDMAIAIFSGTNGQTIQNSNFTINGDTLADANSIEIKSTSGSVSLSGNTVDAYPRVSFNVTMDPSLPGSQQANFFMVGESYTPLSIQPNQTAMGSNTILYGNPNTTVMPFNTDTVNLGTASNRFSGVVAASVSGDYIYASTSVRTPDVTSAGLLNLQAVGNIALDALGGTLTVQDASNVIFDKGASSVTVRPVTSGLSTLGSQAIPWGDAWIKNIHGSTLGGFSPLTLNDNLVPSGSNINLGSASAPFANIYGTNFSGTVIGDVSELNYVIDGGGSVIASGSAGSIEVPFNASVLAWDFLANVSGSLSCDVRRSTYAAYSGTPFAVGNSIVGSEKPTITTAFKGQDTSITTWSGISAGDILNFVVDATPTNITRATLAIKLRKTS